MAAEPGVRVPVNAAVLTVARRRVRLDLENATAVLNKELLRYDESPVDVKTVQSWEAGEFPTLFQADAIAKAYLIPFAALFQEHPPRERLIDFRRGVGGPAKPLSYETKTELHRFDIFCLVAKTATSALGISEDVHIPKLDHARIRDMADVEAAGTEIRTSLGITDDLQLSWPSQAAALKTWREAAQDKGIFVFSQFMSLEECRGASKWEPGGPPAILLNVRDTTAPQIFTLLHEITHLAFSQARSDTVLCDPYANPFHREEDLANRVAGAALVPRSMLKRLLLDTAPGPNYASWPDKDRARLRNALRVSHPVIGIRLKQIGFVEDAGVTRWFPPVPSKSFGKNKRVYQRYRSYLGERTLSVVHRAMQSDLMSVGELSRLLRLKADDIYKIFT